MIRPPIELAAMAAALEESGDYRVLRKLKVRTQINEPDGSEIKSGIFLDVETTGLDTRRSEIIELAMVPFEFSSDGRMFGIGKPLQQFHEPSTPIPAAISAITGITDEVVAGKKIDITAVEEIVEPASIIIAHNASFDRPFAERISPMFETKAWGCSMCDIPWHEEGIDGRRLTDLLAVFSLFFEAHRALEDCMAAVELLSMPLPKSGRLALERLLENARKPTWRIFADGAPYDLKDVLKSRGYRWNAESELAPRAWYIDVSAERPENEIKYLQQEIYQRDANPIVRKITAFDRYSGRI
jgi:DNA polymerase III subunit epsilon